MKLYELLSEAPKRDAYSPKSFFGDDTNAKKVVLARGKKVAQFIKKECKPWFKESNSGKSKFYRGFQKGANEVAFTKKVRSNRRPKDSGAREHDGFNALIKLGGGKANRSNAVFASSDRYVAEEYGQVFVVIPVGEYNYTWHTYYDDWTGMVPWGEILQLKPKKEPKGKSKKSKVEQEYEEKRAAYEKAVADYRALLKKVFTDNGIKAPTPSTWYDIAAEVDMIVNYREGTFSGAPSVKFKNVKKGKTPTVKDGYYTKSKWRKIWVEFYNYLASIPPAKRVPYVNLLRKLDKNVTPAMRGIKFLKMYKDADDYAMVHGGPSKYGHGAQGATKTTWIPSKHKVSELDKENGNLKQFLRGLRVDKGLDGAKQSGNEIMIKSKVILGIDARFYQKVVLPYLNGKVPKIADSEAPELLYPEKPDDDGW